MDVILCGGAGWGKAKAQAQRIGGSVWLCTGRLGYWDIGILGC